MTKKRSLSDRLQALKEQERKLQHDIDMDIAKAAHKAGITSAEEMPNQADMALINAMHKLGITSVSDLTQAANLLKANQQKQVTSQQEFSQQQM